MSYDSNLDSSSTYYFPETSSYVKNYPGYRTLGDYYSNPNCPFRNVPGECPIPITIITPQFGGVGYNLPGFNTNQNGEPMSDSNYFNLNQAYPQYCKRSIMPSTYNS